jgi:hypothetical protein
MGFRKSVKIQRKSCVMQAKMESVGRELYSPDGSVRNVGSQGCLEGVVSEPLSGQERTRLPGAAEAVDVRSGALRLR